MNGRRSIAVVAAAALVSLGATVSGHRSGPASIALAPDTLPRIATIDERFLSYNVVTPASAAAAKPSGTLTTALIRPATLSRRSVLGRASFIQA